MNIEPAELRKVDVLSEATEADLQMIASNGILRAREEGEFFFFEGDPAKYLYILISGRAKLIQTGPSGQPVSLRTIHEWQVFGALGAIREGATYPGTAQATEPSTALALESLILKDMMETRPYLATGLMQLMTGYIQEIQERFRELATEKVERRIARSLVRLTAQLGTKNEEGKIELAFTRQELAEMSGTTIYTVSRTLAEWERSGLVEAGRERVVIRNPHGLVKVAEEMDK